MKLHTGTGIAKWYDQIFIVNIYDPSGSSHRHKRDVFFNSGMVYFLRQLPHYYILAGDL